MNKKMDNKVFSLQSIETSAPQTTTPTNFNRERIVAIACLSFFPLLYFVGKLVSTLF